MGFREPTASQRPAFARKLLIQVIRRAGEPGVLVTVDLATGLVRQHILDQRRSVAENCYLWFRVIHRFVLLSLDAPSLASGSDGSRWDAIARAHSAARILGEDEGTLMSPRVARSRNQNSSQMVRSIPPVGI